MANTNVIQYQKSFQPVLTRQQFAGDTQLLPAWWKPLSEPNQFNAKPALSSAALASSGRQPLVLTREQFPETPQVDKWFVALSEPNAFKVKHALAPSINATGPQAPVLAQPQFAGANAILAGWWQPFGEPGQFKFVPALTIAAVSASGPQAPVLDFEEETGDVPGWFIALSEPVRYPLALSDALQASVTGQAFYPYPPAYTSFGYIFT